MRVIYTSVRLVSLNLYFLLNLPPRPDDEPLVNTAGIGSGNQRGHGHAGTAVQAWTQQGRLMNFL